MFYLNIIDAQCDVLRNCDMSTTGLVFYCYIFKHHPPPPKKSKEGLGNWASERCHDFEITRQLTNARASCKEKEHRQSQVGEEARGHLGREKGTPQRPK